MDCRSPILPAMIGAAGEPGGTLPAGGSQWSFLQFNGLLWIPSSWVLPELVAVGDTGEVLTSINGVGEFQAPLTDLLLYRNAATTLTATTPWLAQWFSANSFATMATAGHAVALRTGILRWLRIFHSTATADNEVLTYTVVVNGIDTALVATLNTNSLGPGSNLTTTVAVNVGDLIGMRVDGVGGSRSLRMSGDFFLD